MENDRRNLSLTAGQARYSLKSAAEVRIYASVYRTQDFTGFCKLQTTLVRDGLVGKALLKQLLLKRRRGLEEEVVILGSL